MNPPPTALDHYDIAALDAAVAHGDVQGERDRGRRRIAMAFDGRHHLSGAMPSFSAEASMMRQLAWCGTNQSRVWASIPTCGRNRS